MAERHAELPWKFSPWHIEEGPSAVRCSTGYLVCETAGDADAKLIVKAVNNHDALVRALGECVRSLIAECREKNIGFDPRSCPADSTIGQAIAILDAVGGSPKP